MQYERTSLHFAAEKGYKDIVGCLLTKKADPNLCNDVSLFASFLFVKINYEIIII